MTHEQFVYWLQGYFELNRANGDVKLSEEQVKMIESHLNTCFNKITDTAYFTPTFYSSDLPVSC